MNTRIKVIILIIIAIILNGSLSVFHSAAQNSPIMLGGTTEIASVTSMGTQANNESRRPAISADGRYVVFQSFASNLVSDDENQEDDIFLHDRVTGETTLISISSAGQQGNAPSYWPSISDDGSIIAFSSSADNLVVGDVNDQIDVFVHNRLTGETTLVSKSSDGTLGNRGSFIDDLSADGRYVVFNSSATNLIEGDLISWDNVFVHDRLTDETVLVSVASDGTQGDMYSFSGSISADGRYVAFASRANNLVPGDTNLCYFFRGYVNCSDVFVHDLFTHQTTRVSVASDGTQGNHHSGEPAISADGLFIAFSSSASNLVPGDTNNDCANDYPGYPDDNCSDIFVHDRLTGEVSRISTAGDGTQGDLWSSTPTISADGRYIGFASVSTNLVAGDNNAEIDIFIHDQVTGETDLVSISSNGSIANSYSSQPVISPDGGYIAFYSYASNLVVGDVNDYIDIFVHDRFTGVNTYSVSGRVTGLDGHPLPGVTVSNGYGSTVITDNQGDYIFSGLESGIYTITLSLDQLLFSLAWQVVSVPPNRSSVDFHQVIPIYNRLPLIMR